MKKKQLPYFALVQIGSKFYVRCMEAISVKVADSNFFLRILC